MTLVGVWLSLMTFDFTPEQQALADRAREAASAIGESVASAIDTLGSIAEDVSTALKSQSLTSLFQGSAGCGLLAGS